MKIKRQLMILTCTLAMVVNGAGAFSQGRPQEPVIVAQGADVMTFQVGQGGGPGGQATSFTYSFEGAEFSFGGKVVKGAPYSADAVTETVQMLSDGNRIVRHTASKIYRDNEGRERREQSLNAVGPWTASGDQ